MVVRHFYLLILCLPLNLFLLTGALTGPCALAALLKGAPDERHVTIAQTQDNITV